MKQFNKKFQYKFRKFNTSVELEVKMSFPSWYEALPLKKIVDRPEHPLIPSDEVCYMVITSCEDSNSYFKRDTIGASTLEKTILRHYTEATNYVDSIASNPSQDELLLASMGFT